VAVLAHPARGDGPLFVEVPGGRLGVAVSRHPQLHRLLPIRVPGQRPVLHSLVDVRWLVHRVRGEHGGPFDPQARLRQPRPLGRRRIPEIHPDRDVLDVRQLRGEPGQPARRLARPRRPGQQNKVAPPEPRMPRAAHHHVIGVVDDLAAFQPPHHQVGPVSERVNFHVAA
jgi:hypothetical protein